MSNIQTKALMTIEDNPSSVNNLLKDANTELVYYDINGSILSGLKERSVASSFYPESIAEQLAFCLKTDINIITVKNLFVHKALIFWTDVLPNSQTDSDGGWAALFIASDSLISEASRFMPFGFIHIDKNLKATFCNETAHRILGTQDNDVLNRGWLAQFGDSVVPALKSYLDDISLHGAPLSMSLKATSPLGRVTPVTVQVYLCPHSGPGQYSLYLLIYDLSETGLMKADLTRALEQDNLTGLLNRSAFLKKVKGLTNLEFENAAFIFIDVNEFKGINDTYGHKFGDKVLATVSRKLSSMMQGREVISRFGGDEFVLCFPDQKDLTTVYNLGRKLVSVVNTSTYILGQKLDIQCSIGICWMPALSEHRHLNTEARIERALDAADQCMYLVKKARSSQKAFKVYDPSLKNALYVQKQKQIEFQRILDEECLCIAFQPIFNKAGCVTSIEALARLTRDLTLHTHIGDVISSANESAGELPLFSMTTLKTLEAFGRIRHKLDTITLNINIDISQLEQPNFAMWLSEKCLEYRIPFSAISIEITELLLESDSVQVAKNLNQLLEMGFSISMDDFGTGYSSLKRLLEYQFHELKVDRYFIENLIGSDKYSKMVSAMVGMGKALDLNLLAEGIETEAQLNLCKEIGFSLFQGFYLAKPMTPNALIAFINNQKTEH